MELLVVAVDSLDTIKFIGPDRTAVHPCLVLLALSEGKAKVTYENEVVSTAFFDILFSFVASETWKVVVEPAAWEAMLKMVANRARGGILG